MPGKPNDMATGRFSPFKDRKTGEQVVDSKKGKKWEIIIELPRRGSKQKRPRKYISFYGSERQAKKEMERLIFEVNTEINRKTIPNDIILDIDSSKITFGEYAETWLQDNEVAMKRNTWESYAGMARSHIIPALGHILLSNMAPLHISRYRQMKLKNGRLDGKEGGLDPGTVNKHIAVISKILEDAASPEKRLIDYNPTMIVKRAKGKSSNKDISQSSYSMSMINCLTIEQLNDLLYRLKVLYSLSRANKEVKDKPETKKTLKWLGFSDKEIASRNALFKLKVTMLYPVVYLAARTGMRRSELLALKWSNIDFQGKIIKVYASSHYGKKREGEESSHYYNTTKEGRPKSYIKITARDVEFLKQFRKEQLKQVMFNKANYKDNGLVFAKNDGTHLRNDTIGKVFTNFARSNGFKITLHGLRHTHCSLLLAAGVPDMFVAKRVGHQNPATTNSTYAHVDKGVGPNLGELFEKLLEENKYFSPEELIDAQQKAESLLDRIGG